MAVDLLERDQFLTSLDELLRQAAVGTGLIALVSGEAGIGKTSLVERYRGACEALFTSRPLGPVYDIAQQAQTLLRSLRVGAVNRTKLFCGGDGEAERALARGGGAPRLAVWNHRSIGAATHPHNIGV